MNTGRGELRIIEELFYSALPLDESARSRLLADQPASIRDEVFALLEEDRRGSMVARAVKGAAAGMAQEWMAASPVGTRVGAYEVQRELGSGGMGSVYLGIRADEAYQRQVAIKFVRAEYDTALFRERFQHERRILGRLDHPNIARLLDAGSNAHGQPYFVMEFVDGEPITVYARKHALSRAERIRIFNQVCDAVRYAHQNLIVHRDLKPGNILVDGAGNPKLLDFGIAKLLGEGGRTDQTAAAGFRILTPDYASPEHAAGQTVTTSSDVYSLGAILFELLLDIRPPHLAEGQGEIDPPRQLGADLGGIVRKAMHRHPEGRYPSANELREDLVRYLEGRPILARSHSMPERLVQFARHYRGFLAASLLVTGGLAAAATISLQSANTAEQARLEAVTERNRAETERKRAEASRAEAVKQSHEARIQKSAAERERNLAQVRFTEQRQLLGKFIEEVQDKIQGLPGSGPAREQSLTLATAYLENMAKDRDAGPAEMRHLALAYLRLGDLRGGPTTANHQSDPRGAVALFAKANAILDTPAMRKDPASLAVLVRLRARQVELHHYLGDSAKVAAALEEGLRLGRNLFVRTNATDPEAGVPLMRVLNVAAWQAVQNWKLEDALAYAGECTTLGFQSKPTDAAVDFSTACLTMEGRAQGLLGRLPGALANLRKAIEIRERILRESPANNGNRRDLMLLFGHLSGFLYHSARPSMNDLPGAVQALEQARMHAGRIADFDPSDRLAQRDLAFSTSRYANLLFASGEWEKAAAQFSESSRTIETLLPDLKDDVSLRLELVFALTRLGAAYEAIPEHKAQAVDVYRRAVRAGDELAKFKALQAAAYVGISAAYVRLARVLYPSAPEEAAKSFARAVEVFQAGRKAHPDSQELAGYEKRELSGGLQASALKPPR
jgi:serine/threonine protein kinase